MILKQPPKETSKKNKNMFLENILFSIFKKRILFFIFYFYFQTHFAIFFHSQKQLQTRILP